MAFDFPSSPTVGQQFTPVAGTTYTWNGYAWATGIVAGTPLAVTIQKFTASGTYIPTASMAYVIVECIGGGGGGGAAIGAAYYTGGGGGSGSYSRHRATAAEIGASQTVTIGAGGNGGTGGASLTDGFPGGDTSVGALCIAKGGFGGKLTTNTGTSVGTGGSGGVAGTGNTLTAAGNPGGNGLFTTTVVQASGIGGSSCFGGGAAGVYTSGTINAGLNAGNYGAGGGGGQAATAGVNAAGGNGSPGIVIITEFAGGGAQGIPGPAGAPAGALAAQGRLTLSSNTPVMTATVSAATTLYYTAYVGDGIPIYNGTTWAMMTLPGGQISVATTDTTKSPAAIGASKVNDWFVWNDTGSLRIGHGPDWSSDTTRSAGTTLVMVNGIWLNNAAITNGPAASRGTYVGTTRSNASSSLDFIFGTRVALGGQAIIGVWNCYNRVPVHMVVQDTTASWTYSAASWGFFNGSATWSVLYVAGLAEDPAMARCIGLGQASATGYPLVAPSFDGSVAALPAAFPASLYSTQIVSATGPFVGEGVLNSIGYHAWTALSYSTGGTQTFIGNNYASLIFDWRC